MWREWIEIQNIKETHYKETSPSVSSIKPLLSPSVWREWIEMSEYMESVGEPVVSLRVEGVD